MATYITSGINLSVLPVIATITSSETWKSTFSGTALVQVYAYGYEEGNSDNISVALFPITSGTDYTVTIGGSGADSSFGNGTTPYASASAGSSSNSAKVVIYQV